MKINANLHKYLQESCAVKKNTFNAMDSTCTRIIIEIAKALKNGNKLLIFGNGGSAADSQHIAAEFMSVLEKKNNRNPLSAISLASDIAFITAHSNDFKFDNIFSRQILGLGKKGDVLLGISTSGKSKNVNKGMSLGKTLGLKRISITGLSGKLIKNNSDLCLMVQSRNTQFIQETYMCLMHVIISEIEKKLGY